MAFKCMDCKECTLCNDEYYMVTNDLWDSVAKRGMLCIGCLESRCGKLLTRDDFADVPLNYMNLIGGSARLRNRLTNVSS